MWRISTVLCVLSLLLAGCSSLPPPKYSENLPTSAYIPALTLFPDESNQCGPAALASLLSFYGQSFEFEQLSKQLVIPAKGGSIRTDMRAQSRQHGLTPYIIPPKIEHLFDEIAAGNPVIVMQNLSLSGIPQWHYAVVRGYDLNSQTITLQSGGQANYTIPISLFRRTWARAKNWGIAPKPIGELSYSVSFFSAMNSGFEFEELKLYQSAYDTYQAVAKRWPNDGQAVVNMGLANIAYRLEQYEQAKDFLLKRLEQYPETADTWNNLSHVMSRLQCPQSAVQAAYCATEIAPNQVILENTLKQMMERNEDPSGIISTACKIPECPFAQTP